MLWHPVLVRERFGTALQMADFMGAHKEVQRICDYFTSLFDSLGNRTWEEQQSQFLYSLSTSVRLCGILEGGDGTCRLAADAIA